MSYSQILLSPDYNVDLRESSAFHATVFQCLQHSYLTFRYLTTHRSITSDLLSSYFGLTLKGARSVEPDFHLHLSPIADAIFFVKEKYLGRKIISTLLEFDRKTVASEN